MVTNHASVALPLAFARHFLPVPCCVPCSNNPGPLTWLPGTMLKLCCPSQLSGNCWLLAVIGRALLALLGYHGIARWLHWVRLGGSQLSSKQPVRCCVRDLWLKTVLITHSVLTTGLCLHSIKAFSHSHSALQWVGWGWARHSEGTQEGQLIWAQGIFCTVWRCAQQCKLW